MKCVGVSVLLFAAALLAQSQVRPTAPPQTQANRFYSPGVDAGGYLYVSGQGPRRADGSLPGTFREQVRQALDNIKAIVEPHGLSMGHIVYMQVYLENMAQYDEMDHAFGE